MRKGRKNFVPGYVWAFVVSDWPKLIAWQPWLFTLKVLYVVPFNCLVMLSRVLKMH